MPPPRVLYFLINHAPVKCIHAWDNITLRDLFALAEPLFPQWKPVGFVEIRTELEQPWIPHHFIEISLHGYCLLKPWVLCSSSSGKHEIICVSVVVNNCFSFRLQGLSRGFIGELHDFGLGVKISLDCPKVLEPSSQAQSRLQTYAFLVGFRQIYWVLFCIQTQTRFLSTVEFRPSLKGRLLTLLVWKFRADTHICFLKLRLTIFNFVGQGVIFGAHPWLNSHHRPILVSNLPDCLIFFLRIFQIIFDQIHKPKIFFDGISHAFGA